MARLRERRDLPMQYVPPPQVPDGGGAGSLVTHVSSMTAWACLRSAKKPGNAPTDLTPTPLDTSGLRSTLPLPDFAVSPIRRQGDRAHQAHSMDSRAATWRAYPISRKLGGCSRRSASRRDGQGGCSMENALAKDGTGAHPRSRTSGRNVRGGGRGAAGGIGLRRG